VLIEVTIIVCLAVLFGLGIFLVLM